jgi:hypothetical protein
VARHRILQQKCNKRTVLRGASNLPNVALLTTVARMPYESILLVVLASKSFETIPSTSFSLDTSPNNSLVKTYNVNRTALSKHVYRNKVHKLIYTAGVNFQKLLLLISDYFEKGHQEQY